METDLAVKVGLIYNPFDPSQMEKHELVWAADNTVADYLVGIPEEVEYKVAINGEPLHSHELTETKLHPDDAITVAFIPKGGVAKDILRIVAMVAVVVGAAALVTLTGATGLAALAVFTSAVLVGGLVVNALLPPAGLKMNKDGTDDQSYGYDGAKNTAKEGVAIPVVYGTFRVGGNYVDLFTENVNDDQYMYGRVVLSDGEINKVSDPELNEQSITDFKDFLYGSTMGTYTEAVNPYFGRSIAQKQRQVKLSDTSYTVYTTTTPVDGIQANFAFPRGLVSVDKKGNKQNRTVTIEAEYRVAGSTGAWIPFEGRNYQTFTTSAYGDYFRVIVKPTLTSTNSLNQTVNYTIQYKKNTDSTWSTWKNINDEITAVAANVPGFVGSVFGVTTFNNFQWQAIANQETYDVVLPEPGLYQFRVIGQGSLVGVSVATDGYGGSNQVSFTDRRAKALRKTWETGPLPRNTYEVRIRRTANEITTDDYIVEELWLTDIGEIQHTKVACRSVATGWFKVKMTDQLQQIPQLTWLVEGVKCHKYDINGNIIATEWTANPAWIVLDMLISERRGAFYNNMKIDFPAYLEWAKYCDDNGLQFNGIFDSTESLWDTLQTVYRIGRATPTRLGTKLSVAVDRPSQPVMLFGPGNIAQDSFRIDYMSLADRATEYEVTYFDKSDRNKQKTIRIVDPVAEARGALPKPVSYSLIGVDNFEQAQKEVWYQLYQNRLLKRVVTFDAPIESIGLNIGDVALVQHDLVDWGSSGRLKSIIDSSTVKLDKVVTLEAGKTYKLLVIHDIVNLATANISSVTDNFVNISGLSSTSFSEDKAHRLVTNTGDEREILEYIYNGSGNASLVLSDLGPITGTVVTIKQVDAIEEKTVTNGPGDTDTLTISSPYATNPKVYANYMFGEETSVKRPFRCRSISGSDIEYRTLTLIEYNELVYSPPEFEIPAPTNRLSKTVTHVTNLFYINELREFAGEGRIAGTLSWNSGGIRNYGGADIYVAVNGSDFVFEKSVLNTNEAGLTFPKDALVDFKVVAFDNTGIRANINTAPVVTQQIISSPRELSAPTSLTWTLNGYPFYANGKVSWTNPSDANRGRDTRVQIKLSSTTIWDDWGLTTEEFLLVNEIPAGTHTVRIRSEFNGSISQWVTQDFTVSAPTLIAPIIATDASSVDHIVNGDGGAFVSFEWSWGGNAKDIDGFVVTTYVTTSASPYVLGSDVNNEKTYTLTPEKRSFILENVTSNKYITFAVKAYKRIHESFSSSGYIYSTNVKPSLASENPYRPENNVAFTGDITGTINGVPVTDISAIVSDNILDKSEKFSLQRDWDESYRLYTSLVSTAQAMGLTGISQYTNLVDAQSALQVYLAGLTPAWNDTTQNTTIVGSTFNNKWMDFYRTANELNKVLTNFNLGIEGIYDSFSTYSDFTDFQNYWSMHALDGIALIVPTDDTGGKAVEFGNNAGSDFALGEYRRMMPYSPEDLHSISFDVENFVASSGLLYLGVIPYDKNKNVITPSDAGSYCYVAAAGIDQSAPGRKKYVGYFRGTADVGVGNGVGGYAPDKANPTTLPSATAFIAPVFFVNYPNAAGIVRIHEVRLSKEDVNVVFTGAYSATRSYYKYESVSYLGRTFASTDNYNLNHAPPSTATSNAYWYLVSDKGTDGKDGSNAFTLVNVANCVFPDQKTVQKTSGGNGSWDGKARTGEAYSSGATVSGDLNPGTFIGLDSAPAADSSYGSIQYAWYKSSDGNTYVYRNGTNPSGASWTSNSERLTVTSDGKTVKYIRGNTVMHSHSVDAANEVLYGTFALADYTTINNITFAPAGISGNDGRDGISAETTGPVAISVPCDSSGNILTGGLAQATGTMRLRHASLGIVAASSFIITNLSNCAATINATTGVYSITDLTAETGSATFSCTYGGNVFSLTISLNKARRGAPATKEADTGSAYTGTGLIKVTDVELVIPAGSTATIVGGFSYQTTNLPSTFVGQVKITVVDITVSGPETDLIVKTGSGSQAYLVEDPSEPGTYIPVYEGGSAIATVTYTNSTGASHYYRFSLYTGRSSGSNPNVGSPGASIDASY